MQLVLCEVPSKASSKVSYIDFKRLPLFSLQEHFLWALLMPPEKEFSSQGKQADVVVGFLFIYLFFGIAPLRFWCRQVHILESGSSMSSVRWLHHGLEIV